MSKFISNIHVFAISARSTIGLMRAGNLAIGCTLGRSGIRTLKREGDGATPRGSWNLLYGLTRLRGTRSGLLMKPMRRDMAWCDAPQSPRYNELVRLPFPQSHEELWRADSLYDVVIVLDHNTRPRLRCGGSAIFIHLMSADRRPTAGCVAITLKDMRKLLLHLKHGSRIVIH